MNKKELRKYLKQKLDTMNPETYHRYSSFIASHLFNHNMWEKHDTIALTISRFPEVDTWPIIRKAWEKGKKVVVPKCLPEQRQMIFKEITSFDQLEKVYFGLLEPVDKLTKEVLKTDIDMIIVPGLGYTANGSRLGFGGGYYDRYLEDYKGETLSLAFSEQMVEDLPTEKHDCRVGAIITEKGWISCMERKK